MFAFRRIALLLALALPATTAAFADDSSSSNPAPAQDQTQAQAQAAAQAQGQTSVQARIRARREARRAQAIRESYDHLYEAFMGMGYLRFKPGPNLQRVTLYSWNPELTRFFDERLGITVDGRGYYGTPYVGLNPSGITKPAISVYSVMGGPTYRFYLQPKYNIGVRAMAGYAQGNFSGDTSGFGGKTLGLYADSSTFVFSGSVPVEYNVAPNIGLRLAPEFVATGFGSSTQSSFGFQGGFVYRFGKL
ncbi:MAG: hypothetical protein WCE75_07455 [Terracidiphilus sp.]